MLSRTLLSLCVASALTASCSFNWDTFQGPRADTDVPADLDDAADAPLDDAPNDIADAAPQCTPAADTCPTGQYCAPAINQCVSGCRADGDCSPDGGAPLYCNVATHACVACATDTHCPLGQLCMGNVCVDGCTPTRACPSARTCCAGGCVDTQGSTTHCGACGSACSLANATPTCIGGQCAVESCRTGFGDCDRSANNGCETDVTTSLQHCGACNMACPTYPRAAGVCSMGRCAMGPCEPGYSDCDGDPMNGCEVNTRSDTSHCGTCATVCSFPGAGAACTMGVCTRTTCSAGFGDCDGNPASCEVTFATDVAHCGRCGNACTFPNGVAACAAGACALARCNAGFGDCDGNAANGCETDLSSSAAHCGMCNNGCVFSGGTGACRSGVCALAACDTGRDNCDGAAANGCEIDLRANLMNCGACGRPCASRPNSTSYCSAMVCGLTCASGFENCDGTDSNGCETDVRTSTSDCGTCGRVCSPAQARGVCTGGVCGIASCTAGFGDCDGIASSGCETDVTGSVANCGACGRACSVLNTANSCVAGACRVLSCTGSFANCDANDQNGCETNLIDSNAHCGACGTVCGAGRSCVNGRCSVAFAGYAVTSPSAAALPWIDACAQPGRETLLPGADDDYTVGTLPFPVSFYGGLNRDYLLNANGFLGFGTLFFNLRRASDGMVNFPTIGSLGSWGSLPTNTAPFPGAYVLGIDLLLGSTGVCVATLGATGTRTWAVEWINANSYRVAGTNFTFELLAYEANQNIDMLYNAITPPAGIPFTAPDPVTVGMQDHRSIGALRANTFSGTIVTGTRIRFSPL
jgi:hypothetical protein